MSQFKVADFENKGRILKKGEIDATNAELKLPGMSDDENGSQSEDEKGDFFARMANKRQMTI